MKRTASQDDGINLAALEVLVAAQLEWLGNQGLATATLIHYRASLRALVTFARTRRASEKPRDRGWCRCAHRLARHLHAEALKDGACFSSSFMEEGPEMRRAMIAEAELCLNWAGRCPCRDRRAVS